MKKREFREKQNTDKTNKTKVLKNRKNRKINRPIKELEREKVDLFFMQPFFCL